MVWANDIMKDAYLSYSANIGDHISYGDINDYLSSFSQYKGIDLVIGGPPCQGFSVAGKMDISDSRSQLIWSYDKAIKSILPKAFIMENVKALGTLKRWELVRDELLCKLQNIGYSVGFCILNASDFDVPQARERIFIIGFKGDSPLPIDLNTMIQSYRNKSKSVRETLSILDKAGVGNNTKTCNAKITIASNPILRKS
ncbi:MAG: DNA (cytosine-5-)-methyltransferase [Rikenellaceae bacterium]